MSSHQCSISGSLSIKPGIALVEIQAACQPLLDMVEASFEDLEIDCSEGTLDIDHIGCWTQGVGYTYNDLVELTDNLAKLVSEPGWVELVDDDTGADDKIDVYL